MKKFLYGVITVLVLITVLGACSNTDEKVTKVENKEETTQTTSAKEEKPEDKMYSVGDTLKFTSGAEITIVSATHEDGNQYVKPEKGKVLKLHVKVVNKGTQRIGFYSGLFNLYDSNGSLFKEYYAEGTPVSGDIDKDKQLEGDIWYDVDGSGNYELVMKPNPADSTEIKFNIRL